MNLLKRLNPFRRKTVSLTQLFDLLDAQSGGVSATYNSQIKEGYKKNGVAYAAIDKIASAAQNVPWILYQDSADGTSEEVSRDHPLNVLMSRPNESSSFQQFMRKIVIQLYAGGAVFVRKLVLGDGRVDSLVVIRKTLMTPVDKKDPKAGWVFAPGTEQAKKLKYDEVLPLFLYDPEDSSEGLSPLQVASTSINQSNFSGQWNLNMLKRDCRPPYFLRVKYQIPIEKADKIGEGFNVRYGGADKVGIPPMLHGDIEYEPSGLGPSEMEWLEGQRLSDRKTAVTIGVPPQLLGDKDAATYSNYQEARKALYTERVLPLLDWLTGEFTVFLVTDERDRAMYFAYNEDDIEALQEERGTKWDRVVSMDCLTINEKRKEIGFDPLDDKVGKYVITGRGVIITPDNEVLLPATLVPADSLLSEGKPKPGGDDPKKPGKKPPKEGDDGDDEEEEEETEEEEEEDGKRIELRAYNLREPVRRRAYWQGINAGRAPFEAVAKALVASRFRRELATLKAALGSSATTVGQLENVLYAMIEENEERWADTYRKIYLTVGGHFFREIRKILSKSTAWPGSVQLKQDEEETALINDVFADEADRYVVTEGSRKIKGISEATRERVRESIRAGIDLGESIPEIESRIDRLYLDQIIPNRSEVIARTEVIAASNKGTLEAGKSMAMSKKQWISTHDDRTREDHWNVTDGGADGQVVDIDQPFVVGGHQLMFPGDTSLKAPAEQVIQCRCTLAFTG